MTFKIGKLRRIVDQIISPLVSFVLKLAFYQVNRNRAEVDRYLKLSTQKITFKGLKRSKSSSSIVNAIDGGRESKSDWQRFLSQALDVAALLYIGVTPIFALCKSDHYQ